LQKRVDEINAQHAAAGKPAFSLKSVPRGAATSVWAGVVAGADAVGGGYCENCHVAKLLEGETFSAVSEGGRPNALDPERAKALWAKSEEMVDERFSPEPDQPVISKGQATPHDQKKLAHHRVSSGLPSFAEQDPGGSRPSSR
jgi:hypothetical protein